jgi:D-alanine-D-alanine ligase
MEDAMAHVLILYNQPILPSGHPEAESETEVLSTVEHVGEALETFGHRISRLGIGRDPGDFVRQVRETGADVVFNLFEGIPGVGESETCIAALLEWLHMPFTGSPARALTLARDKPLSKLVLRGAGLPVPDSLTVGEPDDARLRMGPGKLCSDWTGQPLRWPLIVKLAGHDASVGIEQASVVRSAAELARQAGSLRARFGGRLMIEEYIAGRELTVGVIEKRTEAELLRVALPVSEFEFQPAEGRWPIVTYDAKWSVTSTEYGLTPYREIADVRAEVSDWLRRLAGQAFGVLGLRDYGRIDFRVCDGQPFILEANPNPDLNPAAGLAGVLDAVGMTYRDLANTLVRLALSREDSITS